MAAYENISVETLWELARCIRRRRGGTELVVLHAARRPQSMKPEAVTQRLPMFR
jgi:hypothetical protein